MNSWIAALILIFCTRYGVSEEFVHRTLELETGYWQEAIIDGQELGDGGEAVGICQWHVQSYKLMQRARGQDDSWIPNSADDPRYDPEQSIEMMCYAIDEWGCWDWWTGGTMAYNEGLDWRAAGW